MKYNCRSPIVRKYNGLEYRIPCNQCVTCVIGRKAVWTGRALSEWQMADFRGAFSTLTYDDDHIDNASREDLEPLFEWLRDLYEVRYLVVPDTGDQFGRFHWHMLLFGPELTPQLESDIQEGFECGNVDTRPLARQRIGYTCGYTTKKLRGDPTGRILCSQQFGKAFMVDYARKLNASGRIITGPPRYIKFDGRRYPVGPLQREWFLSELDQKVRNPGAKPQNVADHIVRSHNTETLEERIASEKQEQSKKGETFGQTSKTQNKLRS